MNIKQIEKLANEPPAWSKQEEKTLRRPFDYLASSPGKNFRSELIMIFNSFYKLPNQKVAVISKLVEILHTSSLLIDDIEDSSEWRRGLKASHLVHGIPMTINTANYMYFYAMESLQELAQDYDQCVLNQLLIIFNQEMMNLHRGQGLDIYWRDDFVVPDEQQYLNMVMNKTGGLFRLTVRLMEAFSAQFSGETSLVPLSNLLGILYQIRDDYMNLQDATMIKNKGFAEDVSEGKLSFPIIHGIRHGKAEGNSLVWEILQTRTQDIELKKQLVHYLEHTSGSMQYARNKVLQLGILIKEGYFPLIQRCGHDTFALNAAVNSLCDI
ncbi:LANO_0E09010g1_1 [Lachancea nothofagi CBS 11611]|uniref:LANO_0E09010g1_1 n=1 Tax=Lachancea nothofagi CBS 11611 TaxID=1266666 RepID=A0A1G4JVP7_9SACH|nr:LANO_0E09010g1_1 [Lachancea nothofagi CBS 11611]